MGEYLDEFQDFIITPKVLMEFEQACHSFFLHAKGGVPDDSKVSRILLSFQGQLVQDWISSDCDHLSSLSFKEFLVDLHKAFLP